MRLITVIGARPQFVKTAVFSRFLRDNPSLGIKEILVHTGQHYDANMSDVFFDEMDIPKPDYNLHVGSGSHGKMTGLMLERIEDLLLEKKPDALLVYGDTNSTLAGALAASKLHIPVAHIEAGLRSYMMAMPEEQNRRMTDHISTWLFCPTQRAVDNLARESIFLSPCRYFDIDNKFVGLTGDIMYDASLFYRTKIKEPQYKKGFFLLTIHRQENTDDPQRLRSIAAALNSLADYRFVFPVHPRTKKIMREQNIVLRAHIKTIDPVGYLEMLSLENACGAVVTDSGGVQKEAYFFKKPCITMRDATEWTELVDAGWNTLTGADSEKIINAVKNVSAPEQYPLLYGNGECSKKICQTLKLS